MNQPRSNRFLPPSCLSELPLLPETTHASAAAMGASGHHRSGRGERIYARPDRRGSLASLLAAGTGPSAPPSDYGH